MLLLDGGELLETLERFAHIAWIEGEEDFKGGAGETQRCRAVCPSVMCPSVMGLLPVIGQTLAPGGEHAAGEIGAIRSGQDEEAGVVGDKGEAASAVGNVPVHPLLAVFEVVGRRPPAQEGDLAAIHFGHVAELLADEGVALEIMEFP